MAEQHRSVPSWLSVGAVVALVVVLGVVPLALDRDSFPLSTYPMFSHRRSSAESVDTAVLVDVDGVVRRLSPTAIAATDEVILAGATVSDAIRSGTADVLCHDIAGRVDGDAAAVGGTVEVVTERFDALRWYDGDKEPIERTVHASCEVVAS